MATTEPWRMQCCQRMLNVLHNEENVTLSILVSPTSTRLLGHFALTITAHQRGAVMASCRHEVYEDNNLHWVEQMLRYFAYITNV